MDGNSRWARERGLAAAEGHAEGRRALEKTVRLSRAWGVRALTAFAFSHENMARPKAEVEYLMELFEGFIRDNTDEYARGRYPAARHRRRFETAELTPELHVIIDEDLLDGKLQTCLAGEFSCPDLLIRTSGEIRLSNFLLWQSAYSELFFTETLWPDFGEEEYRRALASYKSRDRRFGRRKF
ncbi:hypothetical protein ACP70R_039205 [Stipagrostis hirtigluma subsp. patula]